MSETAGTGSTGAGPERGPAAVAGASAAAPAGPRARLRRPRRTADADEATLTAALAAGDGEAAERLAEVTYRGIYAALLRLSGDPDLAADLTQDTYRKAWRSLAGFDGRSRFSTWLYRIAYTTYLNHLRRPRPVTGALDETGGADRREPARPRLELVDTSPDPEATAGVRRAGRRLRRAVMELPESLRFTVTARYWADLPVREIARREGVTTVAIRKRLKRALALIEELLTESGKEVAS